MYRIKDKLGNILLDIYNKNNKNDDIQLVIVSEDKITIEEDDYEEYK